MSLLDIDTLGLLTANTMMTSAASYIRRNHLQGKIDLDAVTQELKARAMAAADKALDDAREAFEAGMNWAAQATYLSGVTLAGIEAVKAVVARS